MAIIAHHAIMAEALISREFPTQEEAIKAYFSLGITHGSILCFLRDYHGIDISIRTLRRRLDNDDRKLFLSRIILTLVQNHIILYSQVLLKTLCKLASFVCSEF